MSPITPNLGMTTTELNRLMLALDQARQAIKGRELDAEQARLILTAIGRVESEVYLAKL